MNDGFAMPVPFVLFWRARVPEGAWPALAARGVVGAIGAFFSFCQ